MKAKCLLISCICFFAFLIHVKAQDRIIHGMVTTFDSLPLIGADVMVKSSKQEVKTDTLGRFSVTVKNKDKIRVSARGFNTANVKITEKIKIAAINLRLKPGEKARSYATGYGYVKDVDKLNAMSQLEDGDVDFSQFSNMYDLIRGRFSGVQVHSNGDIVIRGVNSINLSSSALIVVDGVPCDKSILNSIAPVNVKNINILKDGSSAIYGSRGANGVILIETKKGGDNF